MEFLNIYTFGYFFLCLCLNWMIEICMNIRISIDALVIIRLLLFVSLSLLVLLKQCEVVFHIYYLICV